MNEKWVVVRTVQSGWYGPETEMYVLFSTTDDVKYHWNGEQQWTVLTAGWEIVLEYGWIDDDTDAGFDKLQAVFADFDRHFPIEPHDFERAVTLDASGYLAPNGDFYRCSWMGHTAMAQDLTKRFQIPVKYAARPSSHTTALLNAGWLELRPGYVAFESDNAVWATPEQLALLRNLCDATAHSHPTYSLGIVEFLDRIDRHDW